jgi:hypothetical protein
VRRYQLDAGLSRESPYTPVEGADGGGATIEVAVTGRHGVAASPEALVRFDEANRLTAVFQGDCRRQTGQTGADDHRIAGLDRPRAGAKGRRPGQENGGGQGCPEQLAA